MNAKTINTCKQPACLWAVLSLLLSSACPAATGTVDSEHIINVQELKVALDEATSPIAKRISGSQLFDKFDTVNSILQQKDINKSQLLGALKDLQSQMSEFTDDWSEVTEPLWQGQEAIGQTIDKVRGLLARAATGEPTAKVKGILKRYDKRLSDLANAIKGEHNEDRRKRLKQVFANVLSLRQLTEHAGMIDLGPAQQAVYIQIIDSLSNLEMALTNSTFQVEKVRIILEGQADFIDTYGQILGGVIEAESLASMLKDMGGAGQGLGVMGKDLLKLQDRLTVFTESTQGLMERLTGSIDVQTADMVQMPDFDEKDIDRQIEAYLSK